MDKLYIPHTKIQLIKKKKKKNSDQSNHTLPRTILMLQ